MKTAQKNQFSCTFCEKILTRKINLKQHVISVHLDKKEISCSKCDFKTSQKRYLKEHLKGIHDETIYACSLCPHESRWHSNISSHEKTVHNITNKLPTLRTKKKKGKDNSTIDNVKENRKFLCSKCPNCGLKFKSTQSMKIHLTNKHFRKCLKL